MNARERRIRWTGCRPWIALAAAWALGACASASPSPGRDAGTAGGRGGAGSGGSEATAGGSGGASGGAAGGGAGGGPTTGGPDATPSELDAAAPSDAELTGGTPPADATAGDAGPGTTTSDDPLPPCKATKPVAVTADLAAAITGAQPGDCLELADGSFTFPEINATGSEGAPIVIRAKNRGKVVVSSGALSMNKAAYVVLEGFDVTTSGTTTTLSNGASNGIIVGFSDSHDCRLTRMRIHPMSPVADRDWVVISGGASHHNRVDHNDLGPLSVVANMMVIDGTGQEQPLVPGQVSQYNQIDHNYLHDIAYSGGNNWEAMRIGRSWQGPTKGFNVIEHNFLRAANGDPETISIKSSANTIRYNTMRATAGEISLRHGNGSQVYGNYIIADGKGGSRGIRVYGADHRIFNNYVATSDTGIWLDDGESTATNEPGALHYEVYRAWVFNNTVIGQDIRIGGTKTAHPKDCRAANNIITGGGKLNPDGTMIVSEGNIVGGTSPLTMQDGIFRLLPGAAGAAAIDKAVNAPFYMITDDIEGQGRMVPDVGADEQSSAAVAIKGPLTEADVGPDAP